MKQYIKYILIILINLSLWALFTACTDDLKLGDSNVVPEGEPATISVTLLVPEMNPVTRSAGIEPESTEARTVTDIWVGIYNIATGKRVGQKYISSNEMQDIYRNHHGNYASIPIDKITTYSGQSWIVAVANGGNSSINVLTCEESNSIMQMLQGKSGETWDSFLQIAGSLSEPDVLMRGSASSFIMCGSYRVEGDMSHPNEDALQSVDVFPKHNYGGYIHLRRLDSYFKFNISADRYITFTPVSWQVANMPGISYLFEHTPGLVESEYSINAADYPVENINLWGPGEKSFYHNSKVFGPAEFSENVENTNPNVPKIYSFDFYQLENKHTGIIRFQEDASDDVYYQEREKEWKFGDESSNDLTNSGWYKSLVDENEIEESTPSTGKGRNNNASYVIIKGHLEYYYESGDDNCTPVQPPEDPENADYVRRVADVTYTIHLGYCEGSGRDKANDFNVRRNTKYTYNITIGGADKIRVEAQKEKGELQPGAEGIVTDLMNNQILLDSHYHVVNIKLTDKARAELTWRIQAPFDNEIVDLVGGAPIESLGDVKGVIDMTRKDKENYNDYNNKDYHDALPNNQFYNWIQIRPTTERNIIADYPGDPRLITRKIRNDDDQDKSQYYSTDKIKPYVGQGNVRGGNNSNNDGSTVNVDDGKGIWYLEHLCNPYKYKWNGSIVSDDQINYNETLDDTDEHWYTFFIDEYVYEYELDRSKNTLTQTYSDQKHMGMDVSGTMDIRNWRTFVNQEDRRLWLSLSDMKVSKDKESSYSTSQYYISQESIQTYYGSSATEGIGLEHTNESYKGTNNPWSFSNYFVNDPENAEKYVLGYYVIPGTEGAKDTEVYNYSKSDGLLNQYYFVRYRTTATDPNTEFNPVNYQQVRWNEILKPNNQQYSILRKGESHDRGTHTSNVTYYIPDHPNDIMMACLSRNRDLNNDGIIGANEIRWYLPAVATYTRMVLGASSLRNPLFNTAQYGRNDIPAGTGTGYSHYAASDRAQLWAEELAATGNLYLTGKNAAKTLRCIRNIGQYTNLSPHDDSDGYRVINAAYQKRDNQNIIDLKFYKTEAQRPYQSGPIPEHDVNSILSRAPASFQFAKEDCKTSNLFSNLDHSQNYNPFQNYYDSIHFNGDYGNIRFGYGENNDPTLNRTNTWSKRAVLNNNLCRYYSEQENRSDLGTWRLPNISEMAIIVFLDANDYSILGNNSSDATQKRYLTCSREYFNGRGNFFMKATRTSQIITASERDVNMYYVRCVKDVR